MALNSYYDTKITVAFDNKDKFWKTRYSFSSSCYGWLNKILTSFRKSEFVEPTESSAPHDIIHIHDQTSIYNSFHGDESVGSAIQVSFNDRVSTNKLFKSMSMEGTQNISGQPGLFVTNSDNSPDKNFSMGVVKDKGGILYFDIGQSQKNSSANVKCIGNITGIISIIGESDHPFFTQVDAETDGGRYIDVKVNSFDLGASAKATGATDEEYSGCLYFVKRITIDDEGQQSQPEYIADYTDIDGSGFSGITDAKLSGSWNGIFNDSTEIDTVNYYAFDLADPTIDIPNYYNGSKILKIRTSALTTEGNLLNIWSGDTTDVDGAVIHNTALGKSVYLLYQVSRNDVYGDDAKGQYAELAVSLGFEKFELYALNLNYEPTNLDHSR
jgi:hypothetical protein